MICKYCGHAIDDDSNYCNFCKKKIDVDRGNIDKMRNFKKICNKKMLIRIILVLIVILPVIFSINRPNFIELKDYQSKTIVEKKIKK